VKSILIVDDSAAIRHSLRALLGRQAGWEVCGEAVNGREGLDKALQLQPDLVVLDLSMPIMNGLQAARELQRLMPKLPILMFTNFSSPQIEQEALASGVTAVKSKSESVDSLCGSIQGLLDAA
jgi:DNA-binding NarL/FixJ family response regulator